MEDRNLLEKELKNLFEANIERVEGKWYLINGRVIRVCYSKAFSRIGYDRYFFGFQRNKYEQYKSRNVHILFVCGAFNQAILLSSSVLDDILKGVPVANDKNWKLDIHQYKNQFEISRNRQKVFKYFALSDEILKRCFLGCIVINILLLLLINTIKNRFHSLQQLFQLCTKTKISLKRN